MPFVSIASRVWSHGPKKDRRRRRRRQKQIIIKRFGRIVFGYCRTQNAVRCEKMPLMVRLWRNYCMFTDEDGGIAIGEGFFPRPRRIDAEYNAPARDGRINIFWWGPFTWRLICFVGTKTGSPPFHWIFGWSLPSLKTHPSTYICVCELFLRSFFSFFLCLPPAPLYSLVHFVSFLFFPFS